MKSNWRKALSLLLAIVMVLGLVTPALAAPVVDEAEIEAILEQFDVDATAEAVEPTAAPAARSGAPVRDMNWRGTGRPAPETFWCLTDDIFQWAFLNDQVAPIRENVVSENVTGEGHWWRETEYETGRYGDWLFQVPGPGSPLVVNAIIDASRRNNNNEVEWRVLQHGLRAGVDKFLSNANRPGEDWWVSFRTIEPISPAAYFITSANDAADRDPRDWTLYAREAGATEWIEIDRQDRVTFGARWQTQAFGLDLDGAYFQEFRFFVRERAGATTGTNQMMQFSEIGFAEHFEEWIEGDDTRAGFLLTQIAARPNVEWTGPVARPWYRENVLMVNGLLPSPFEMPDAHVTVYDGDWVANETFVEAQSLTQIRDLTDPDDPDGPIPVEAHTNFSFMINPQGRNLGDRNNDYDFQQVASHHMIDLRLRRPDGSTALLSELGARCSMRFELTPQGQGRHFSFHTATWNRVESHIGAVAEGYEIIGIYTHFQMDDAPVGRTGTGPCVANHLPTPITTFFDDIRVFNDYRNLAQMVEHARPNLTDIRQGAKVGTISGGSNSAFVGLPTGFNYWAPGTETGTQRYQVSRTSLIGITMSRLASRHMGERASWNWMVDTRDLIDTDAASGAVPERNQLLADRQEAMDEHAVLAPLRDAYAAELADLLAIPVGDRTLEERIRIMELNWELAPLNARIAVLEAMLAEMNARLTELNAYLASLNSLVTTAANTVRSEFRADRQSEIAHVHYYSVTFVEDDPRAGGAQMEVTPTMRGAVMRFTFPADAPAANVIFSAPVNGRHGESDTVGGVLSGRTGVFPNMDDGGRSWTAFTTDSNAINLVLQGNNSRIRTPGHGASPSGAGRMWMAGEFDTTPLSFVTTTLANGATSARTMITFPQVPGEETVVEMRLATSWMSFEQAQRNLELEIGIGNSNRWFDQIFVEAYDIWDEMLGAVTVNNVGGEDCWINYWDLIDLYSKIQRSIMYPTSKHENTTPGPVAFANANPTWQYASPYRGTAHAPVIRDGYFVYNEGFWDTFRTKWGGVSLLWPELTNTLADGWVSHFTDQDSRGNFAIPRWNNPGQADLMVMTSSDVILAELIMRGIEFDWDEGLSSGRKSSTVVSRSNPSGGRKGLQESIFRGWTAWNTSAPIGGGGDRAVAWTLEGYTNDSGLAYAARRLAERYREENPATYATSDVYRDFMAEFYYFGNRAIYHQNTMNPMPVRLPWWVRDIPENVLDESNQYIITPFARQRNRDGSWANLRPGAPGATAHVGPAIGAQPVRDWCPWIWGWGYTEENAFPFAIMVMQDGVGMANVHGGPHALGNYMDWLMTDNNNVWGGGYNGWIHETSGKREVKMGQFGSNNQTAYHVPFMFLYSDRPEMASYWVHTMLNRGFHGAGVHRAYLGEEDNGAKSSFYYLSALGLMSLNMGSGHMTLTTPKFPDVTINPIGAPRPIHIIANDADGRYNVFFDGLYVDGEEWDRMDIGPEMLFAHTDETLVIEFNTTSDREAANAFQWGGSYEGGLAPPLSWTEEFNSEGLTPEMLMDVTYDCQLVNWTNMTTANNHPNLLAGNARRTFMARPEVGGVPIDGSTVPVIGDNVTLPGIVAALQDLPEDRDRSVFVSNIPAQRNLLTTETPIAAVFDNQYQRGGARNLFDNMTLSGIIANQAGAAIGGGAAYRRFTADAQFEGSTAQIFFYSEVPSRVEIYTLTSGGLHGHDPAAWTLQASNDGINWVVLDEVNLPVIETYRKDYLNPGHVPSYVVLGGVNFRDRALALTCPDTGSSETLMEDTFRWRHQTRPFVVPEDNQGYYRFYKLDITAVSSPGGCSWPNRGSNLGFGPNDVFTHGCLVGGVCNGQLRLAQVEFLANAWSFETCADLCEAIAAAEAHLASRRWGASTVERFEEILNNAIERRDANVAGTETLTGQQIYRLINELEAAWDFLIAIRPATEPIPATTFDASANLSTELTGGIPNINGTHPNISWARFSYIDFGDGTYDFGAPTGVQDIQFTSFFTNYAGIAVAVGQTSYIEVWIGGNGEEDGGTLVATVGTPATNAWGTYVWATNWVVDPAVLTGLQTVYVRFMDDTPTQWVGNFRTFQFGWSVEVDYTFDLNGGTGAVPPDGSAFPGAQLPAPAADPTRGSELFVGWFPAEMVAGDLVLDTNRAPWNFATDGILMAHDQIGAASLTRDAFILAALFADPQVVMINAGAGLFPDGASTRTLTLPIGRTYAPLFEEANTPSRAGHEFGGWFTAANGAGDRILPTTEISNDPLRQLFAHWIAVDKSDLADAIDEAEALVPGDHTAASWEAVEEALEAAREVYADPHATQAEVDAAEAALRDALDALVNIGDLADAIDEASALTPGGFTPETWGPLAAALVAARAVYADPYATQAEVDAAEAALRDALDALTEIGPAIFPDTLDHWVRPYVLEAYARGIILREIWCPVHVDYIFQPREDATRAMAADFIWRTAGAQTPVGTVSPFPDVTPSDWFFEAVLWANENGIIFGRPDGTFAPHDTLERRELSTMLKRLGAYFGVDTTILPSHTWPAFDDHDDIGWAEPYIRWNFAVGLIQGDNYNNVHPQRDTERAEAVTTVVRSAREFVD